MNTRQSVTCEQPTERLIVLAVFAKAITKELGKITNVGNVLLGKEADNIWRFPGGHLQPREQEHFLASKNEKERRRIVLKALKRELGEEIEVSIQEIHFFKKVPGNGIKSQKPLHAYVYIVHPHGDVSIPESSNEFIELRWIEDSDLLNCQKKGEHVSPLACKILKLLRTEGIH